MAGDITKQIWLFDDHCGIRAYRKRDIVPPHFDNPKNDNERLLNMQYEYCTNGRGNRHLQALYMQLRPVAYRLVCKECRRNSHLRYMSGFDKWDAADDSVSLMIEQYKKNGLVVMKSITAYLYLQVRKTLYGGNLATKFERWCVDKNIDCMHTSVEKLEECKKQFEMELKEQTK
jgi:hypothetical protein